MLASAVPYGFAIGGLDVAVIAFAGHAGTTGLGGALLAALAAGIGLGSLLWGLRPRTEPAPARGYAISCAITTLMLSPLALATAPAQLAVGLFLVGLSVAPLTAYEFTLLDRVAPPDAAVEAVAWLTCAGYIGAAAGTALTGALIDHAGVPTALLTCALATTVAAPLVWCRRATL